MKRKLLDFSLLVLIAAILVKAVLAAIYYSPWNLPVPHEFKAWVNVAVICSGSVSVATLISLLLDRFHRSPQASAAAAQRLP